MDPSCIILTWLDKQEGWEYVHEIALSVGLILL